MKDRIRGIELVRKQYGMSRKELTDKLEITRTSYSQKVNGHSYFNEREINIAIKLFGKTYEELFSWKEVEI